MALHLYKLTFSCDIQNTAKSHQTKIPLPKSIFSLSLIHIVVTEFLQNVCINISLKSTQSNKPHLHNWFLFHCDVTWSLFFYEGTEQNVYWPRANNSKLTVLLYYWNAIYDTVSNNSTFFHYTLYIRKHTEEEYRAVGWSIYCCCKNVSVYLLAKRIVWRRNKHILWTQKFSCRV